MIRVMELSYKNKCFQFTETLFIGYASSRKWDQELPDVEAIRIQLVL